MLSTAGQMSEYPNVVLFRYIFHTSFIDQNQLTIVVDPRNLDAVCCLPFGPRPDVLIFLVISHMLDQLLLVNIFQHQ